MLTCSFRTVVEKGTKFCTAMQRRCGYKNALRAHRYFAPLAKYFTVFIIYQPLLVLFSAFNSYVRFYTSYSPTSSTHVLHVIITKLQPVSLPVWTAVLTRMSICKGCRSFCECFSNSHSQSRMIQNYVSSIKLYLLF